MVRGGQRFKSFHLLLCVAMIFTITVGVFGAVSLRVLANGSYSLSLNEGGAYGGSVTVTAVGGGSESMSVNVGGATLAPRVSAEATFNYLTTANTDNTVRAKNVFTLNGGKGSPFKSDGIKGMSVNANDLKNGVNTIRIIIGGVYGGATYNPSKPHGIKSQGMNCDDFIVQNFTLNVPGGEELIPSVIREIKPVAAGKTDFVVETSTYNLMKEYWLGDGWDNADSYAGHSNARLNIPYAIELDFNYNKPKALASFDFNTRDFADGEYDVKLLAGGNTVVEKKILIDNIGPIITTPVTDGMNVVNGYRITAEFADAVSGMKLNKVMLGSEEITLPYAIDKADGKYNVVFMAEDSAGNKSYLFRNIVVGDKADFKPQEISYSDGVVTIEKSSPDQKVTVLEANRLEVKFGYGLRTDNTSNIFTQTAQYGGYQQYKVMNNEEVASYSAMGNPFQTFTADVTGVSGSVMVDFEGGSREGERFAVKAFNTLTKSWTTVADGEGTAKLSFVLNTAQYSDNNQIKLVVTPEYLDENRDSMYWITDTQYLTKFPDLYHYYDKALKYCADEYLAGKMGYLVHTGDIVEDNVVMGGTADGVEKQWQVAKNAFKSLDDAKVPYGVVTGNHDTGTNINTMDYSYYTRYFGEKYYNSNPWYGGGQEDNKNHYDLVTIGGYDFVALYLGYGIEGTDDTVAWANEVLKKYSHRNAFINTHAYLLPDTTEDPTSRADIILDKIVKPNDNVKFLLCGHNDGAARKTVKLSETRDFKIILSDYQFIEREYTGVDHIVGTTHGCNGEGYLRTIKIGDNSVSMDTYSPVVKKSIYPYGRFNDKFTEEVIFDSPDRKVVTKYIAVAALGSRIETAAGEGNTVTANYGDSDAVAVKTEVGGGYNFTILSTTALGVRPTEEELLPLDYMIFKNKYDMLAALKASNYTDETFATLSDLIQEYKSIDVNSDYKEIKLALTQLDEAYSKLALSDKSGGIPAWAMALIIIGVAIAALGGTTAVVFILKSKKRTAALSANQNQDNGRKDE